MTPLFSTKRLGGAKMTCSKQMGLTDLSRQGQRYTDPFKPLLRDSVLTKFLSLLITMALGCVLAPRSYAQTSGRAAGEAAGQSATTASSMIEGSSTASGAAETDKPRVGHILRLSQRQIQKFQPQCRNNFSSCNCGLISSNNNSKEEANRLRLRRLRPERHQRPTRRPPHPQLRAPKP